MIKHSVSTYFLTRLHQIGLTLPYKMWFSTNTQDFVSQGRDLTVGPTLTAAKGPLTPLRNATQTNKGPLTPPNAISVTPSKGPKQRQMISTMLLMVTVDTSTATPFMTPAIKESTPTPFSFPTPTPTRFRPISLWITWRQMKRPQMTFGGVGNAIFYSKCPQLSYTIWFHSKRLRQSKYNRVDFCPLTYNGEVAKMTWPEVTDIKNPRYTFCRHWWPHHIPKVS